MMQQQVSTSTNTVRQIRDRLERASSQWMFETSGSTTKLTAIDHGTEDPQPVCEFLSGHNPADPEFLACAHQDITSLLQIIDRATAAYRKLQAAFQPKEKAANTPKDYAANAAIATGNPKFRRYLREAHGQDIPNDAEEHIQKQAADDAVRKLLNITSRKELNTDKAAKQRWLDLNADFWRWNDGY